MDAGRSLRIEMSSHDHPKDGYIPVSQRREKVLRKHTRCPTAFKGLLLEHFLPFGSASARCRPSRSRFIAYSPRLPAWHQRRWSGQSHLEFRRPTLRRKSKMSAIDGCRSPEVAERRERPRNRRFQALDTGFRRYDGGRESLIQGPTIEMRLSCVDGGDQQERIQNFLVSNRLVIVSP